jgi:hypothetical protein
MNARRPAVMLVVLTLLVGIGGILAVSMVRTPVDPTGQVRRAEDAPEAEQREARPVDPSVTPRPGPMSPRPVAAARAVRSVTSVRGAPASVVVQVSGTVDGPSEPVYLSGSAHITSSLVRDPDFGRWPRVILSVDLGEVSGVGLSTGARYASSAEDTLIRRLAPSDQIELTFPFFPKGPGGASLARSALASFDLTFDVKTGQLTGGTASLTTPGLPE